MDQADTDWQAWYDRHGPALLLFARQLTRSLAKAEDAMHDGFVRFWKQRERVDDPAAYLYRAVRHAALDRARSDSRRARRELKLARERPPAEPPPWRHAARDEAEAQLRSALDTLEPGQRELVVMRVWGGLTFTQIATATDLPRSTVAARYASALNALQQAIALPAEELL